MSAPNPTNLTHADALSRPIGHLVRDMQDRLLQLRIDNDSGDAEVTAKRRGRIAEIKDWLALIDQAQLAARADSE